MQPRVVEVAEEEAEEEDEAVPEAVAEADEVLVEDRLVGEAGEGIVVADLEAAEGVDALAEGPQEAEEEEEAGDASKVYVSVSPIQSIARDGQQATLLFIYRVSGSTYRTCNTSLLYINTQHHFALFSFNRSQKDFHLEKGHLPVVVVAAMAPELAHRAVAAAAATRAFG
jgi:hypothetical protein